MGIIEQLLYNIIHIDASLLSFVNNYGMWTYVILFAVIFCETGLVVLPFLPGDSLLFAAGTIAAKASDSLNIQLLMVLLILASVLGNKVNYLVGRMVGPRVFKAEKLWLLNKKHLTSAHEFYEKHGGKTIIFARFIPIIRTFAPFVAGAASMNLAAFTTYNVVSAVLWIGSLLSAGYFFGALPFVRDHFSLMVYGIIGLSLLPPILAFIYRKSFAKTKATQLT